MKVSVTVENLNAVLKRHKIRNMNAGHILGLARETEDVS